MYRLFSFFFAPTISLPASPAFDSGEMLNFRYPGDFCGALEKPHWNLDSRMTVQARYFREGADVPVRPRGRNRAWNKRQVTTRKSSGPEGATSGTSPHVAGVPTLAPPKKKRIAVRGASYTVTSRAFVCQMPTPLGAPPLIPRKGDDGFERPAHRCPRD